MGGNIINVDYENCKSALYEIGTSNVRHIKKINEYLSDAIASLFGMREALTLIPYLDDTQQALISEKKRYEDFASNLSKFQKQAEGTAQFLDNQLSQLFNGTVGEKNFSQMENTVNSYYEQCIMGMDMAGLEKDGLSSAEIIVLSQLNGLVKTCKTPKELQDAIKKLKEDKDATPEYQKVVDKFYEESFGSSFKTDVTVAGIVKDAMSNYYKTKFKELPSSQVAAIQLKVDKLSEKLYDQELKINKYVKPGGKTYQKYNSILTRLNEQESVLEENSENHFAGIKCAENMKLFNAAIISAQLGDKWFKDTIVHGMDFEDTTQDLFVTGIGISASAVGGGIAGSIASGAIRGAAAGPVGVAVGAVSSAVISGLYSTYAEKPIHDKSEEFADLWEEQQW